MLRIDGAGRRSMRSLVHGVHDLAKTFVRDGGLPARVIQCIVPDASPGCGRAPAAAAAVLTLARALADVAG